MSEDPVEQAEEGWYTDPYGLHEARWMSDGRPTKLVRDGTTEAYDEPPAEPPTRPAIRIEPPVWTKGPVDLRRADEKEEEEPFDSKREVDAVFDVLPKAVPPATGQR